MVWFAAHPMDASPPQILVVSKPLAPPWNDSGKNLPRDVARFGERFRYRVFVPRGAPPPSPECLVEPLYSTQTAGFAPRPLDKARLLARLFHQRGEALRHFFFAPNPLTSTAARLASRLCPLPTVQTLSSRPRRMERLERLLFADRLVALSRATESALDAAGIDRRRIARIPPGVPLRAAAPSEEERRAGRGRYDLPAEGFVVLFPGDLEFSAAAETFAGAVERLLAGRGLPGAIFVLACRRKTTAAAAAEEALRARLAPSGPAVRFAGEVSDMPSLLAAADIVVLPADDLYAKMDLPLVLLEALAAARPLIVADVAPLSEVIAEGGGLAVPPRDPIALAHAIRTLASETTRRALAEEAFRAARESFGVTLCARRHEELYAELLAERGLVIPAGATEISA